MLFDSAHVRVTAEHGTATLWLAFPGEPANALDSARLRELAAAAAAVAARPDIRVLVVRSALPHGFCAGLRPEAVAALRHPADRAAFAWHGQQVFARLANLEAVTVAFIDGPCLGVGLELALACDRRVCVARPTTHLGFPDRLACFGGSARLRALLGRRADDLLASGRTLSGREALALALVDVACCERRGKIELRTVLDGLERRPVKPRRPAELVGLAAERRAFAAKNLTPQPPSPQGKGVPVFDLSPPPTVEEGAGGRGLLPLPPFPAVVGLLGDAPDAARIVAEAVLRGGSAVVCGDRDGVCAGLDVALARGFVTPLEAEQARRRVQLSDGLEGFERAGLVFVSEGHAPSRLGCVVRPRTIVCAVVTGESDLTGVLGGPSPSPGVRQSRTPGEGAPATGSPGSLPRRLIRIAFGHSGRVALLPQPSADPDAVAAVAAWLKPFGLAPDVPPGAAGRLLRAA